MIHLGKITADAAAILAMTVTAGTDVTAMTVTAGADVTAMTVTAMTVTAGADVTAMTVTAMTVTAGADVTAIGLGNDIDGAVSAAPFFYFFPNQTSRNLLHQSHLTCFFLEYPMFPFRLATHNSGRFALTSAAGIGGHIALPHRFTCSDLG